MMKSNHHILVVDDDKEIRKLVSDYLLQNAYRVSIAASGTEMRKIMESTKVDLIILDLMLPGEDGLSLCRDLRSRNTVHIPVLMLTALREETDRIIGLEMGADDYLIKPFAPRELLARIRAVMRRTLMMPPNLQSTNTSKFFTFAGWCLNTSARHLIDENETVVHLTSGEYGVLRVLIEHPHRVLTRDHLLNLTQGRDADPFDRSIDLLISRLRQRLREDAREPQMIKTVRNGGYVFCADVVAIEVDSK